ncbi:MAG: peptide deformylase [Balneolaceae bacterium]
MPVDRMTSNVLNILKYPDKRLREVAKPIEEDDYFGLSLIFAAMKNTLRIKGGVGLAATQVGIPLRLIVVAIENQPVHCLANPVITEYSEDTCTFTEGCLSVPYASYDKVRPRRVKVEHYDWILRETHTIMADGLLARVIQHEIDHLDGKLFIDELSPLKINMLQRAGKKREKRGH